MVRHEVNQLIEVIGGGEVMLPDDERRARLRDIKTYSSHRFLETVGSEFVSRENPLTPEDLRAAMDDFVKKNPGTILETIELGTHVFEFGPEVIATFAEPLTTLARAEVEQCEHPGERLVRQMLLGIMVKGFDLFFGSRGGVH
ncbi:MAG: hypothetical protein HYS86_03890 [Candidatus Chisholmbacteria bacterium]|nr:hypothetical protein [Candidatus Chisholmbacteria bacterium]